MGMFDFFRRKSVEEKAEVESFEEAVRIFEEKVEALREREREVLFEIEGRFGDFYVSIEKGLMVLEGIDIEGKKEHERAKILVRQGLNKYIDSVRVLLKELRVLEKERLVGFVDEVGRVFIGFEETSFKVYERATYLVGDEMMVVRNEIRKFYNGLVKMFEGKRSLIGDLARAEEIKLKLGEVGLIEGKLGEFDREILVNDIGIKKGVEEIERLKEEVEGIRKSVEYLDNLRAKEEVKVLSKEFEGEVVKLKGLIDFKKLIGVVHINEKELGIVKRFRDSFVSEFSRDSGKLLGLLKGAGMMSSDIDVQVALISGLKDELGEVRKSVEVDVVVGKLEEVEKIEREVELKRIAGVKVYGRIREVGVRLGVLKDEVVGFVGGLGV